MDFLILWCSSSFSARFSGLARSFVSPQGSQIAFRPASLRLFRPADSASESPQVLQEASDGWQMMPLGVPKAVLLLSVARWWPFEASDGAHGQQGMGLGPM